MDVERTTPDGVTPDEPAVTPAPEGAERAVPGTSDAGDEMPESVQALEQVVGMRGVDATQHAQELLAEHVPLALLVDLLTPTGDTSADLLADEGLPEDAWWDGDAPADGVAGPSAS
ncbi:hypothetical protein [Cellulomonas sp.]|uniref:hypothetical protein n=1 Tax=Cellulomonas sp. TaxID=40001 RepID=UPI0028126B5B|nr:hypothetical protein [Cellulomonas sp.]